MYLGYLSNRLLISIQYYLRNCLLNKENFHTSTNFQHYWLIKALSTLAAGDFRQSHAHMH